MEYCIVDSVSIIPPGNISQFQLDPIYVYKCGNDIRQTKSKVQVGDTIIHKWIKVTEDTLAKYNKR